MGTAVAAIVALAPWLAWISFGSPVVGVALAGIAIVCALHGWGRLVTRCASSGDIAAPLALVWGVAAVLAVSGVMLALGVYDARLLVLVGTVAHSIDTAMRIRDVGDEIEAALARPRIRFWLIPAVMLVVVAIVNLLAAAGQGTARPFDDETNVIAQVQRLATTGALADPIGLPRATQLGGHITLGALATAFGDAQLARIVDHGVGVLLFLWLACSQLRPRDGESTIWCVLIIVLAAAFRPATADLLPLWMPAALVLGCHATLASVPATPRAMLPIGLVIAALCVVRRELAPVGLAFAVGAWWTTRDARRTVALVASIAMPVLTYVVARQLAWADIGDVHGAVSRRGWPIALELGLFVAIGAAILPLVALAQREVADRRLRWLGIALAAGVGGITSRLAGSPPLSIQLVWPIAAAVYVAFAAAVVRQATLRQLALVLAAIACVLVWEAQDAPGRRAWWFHTYEMTVDIEYLRHRPEPSPVYEAMLARVPRGQRVAVWIARPELLDYTAHDVIDLRTPNAARANKLDALARATGAHWLLVEGTEPPVAPLVGAGRVLANRDGLQLVELAR